MANNIIHLLAAALLPLAMSIQASLSLFEKLPLWEPSGNTSTTKPDRYVFRDARTGEIVISYPEDKDVPTGARITYRYRPQNQVAPTIRIVVSRSTDATYRYSYSVSNGPDARQDIENWSIIGPGPDCDIVQEHPRWGKVRLHGSAVVRAALPGAPDGELLDWSSHAAQGLSIRPGQREGEFVITSSYRPGFTTAYVQGGQPLNTNGDLPQEVGTQLLPLMTMTETNRIVLTLGPRFAPEATRTDMAADFRNGLSEMIKAGSLQRESGFPAAADQLLDACSAGDTEQCRALKQALPAKAKSEVETELAAALSLAFQ